MSARPVCYVVPGEFTSPRFGRAFARGCQGQVETADTLREGPVAMFGSPARWALLQRAIAEDRTWYYGDHGYFGRGKYYRVTRNGYQADGTRPAPPARFLAHKRTVAPWRSSGAHVVICPNSGVYFDLFGLDADDWLEDVQTALRAHTDRELRARWKKDDRPLAADLVDAWAVVAFSSTSAVEALLAGVPVFVLAPFAAAARMGLADLARIETPIYPDDREPFAWSLAAQQWTLAELARGDAWRMLAEDHPNA